MSGELAAARAQRARAPVPSPERDYMLARLRQIDRHLAEHAELLRRQNVERRELAREAGKL